LFKLNSGALVLYFCAISVDIMQRAQLSEHAENLTDLKDRASQLTTNYAGTGVDLEIKPWKIYTRIPNEA
jgi:hypothetical protein